MKLTPEQKKSVSDWISTGASISDVQKRLRDEFQLSFTFIDTRFLIDDLGLELKTPPPPKPTRTADFGAPPAGAPVPGGPGGLGAVADTELVDEGDAYAAGADEFADDPPPAPPPGPGGAMKVDIDRLMRPGTMVSGTVKFSDGQSGKWGLDQMGRLVFEGTTPGYRPSAPDLQAFQRELSAQLQRQGY